MEDFGLFSRPNGSRNRTDEEEDGKISVIMHYLYEPPTTPVFLFNYTKIRDPRLSSHPLFTYLLMVHPTNSLYDLRRCLCVAPFFYGCRTYFYTLHTFAICVRRWTWVHFNLITTEDVPGEIAKKVGLRDVLIKTSWRPLFLEINVTA